jgi:methionyl-tRNA formyltransferase
MLAVTLGPWHRASRQPAGRAYSGVDAYYRIPADRIFPDVALRDSGAVDLLKSLRPDATICLGGPIVPGAFIGASPLTLNFHSGISPIYNGSSSAEFAFANGHPHLCGGTLMKMNAAVDGGEILAHFLPAVEGGDSPSSLFAKIVMGAATTYDRVLAYVATHGCAALTSVPQPKPLFQTRGAQLGWYHATMIERFWRKDIANQATRGEELIEYWNAGNAETAHRKCHQTIDRLLWAGRF